MGSIPDGFYEFVGETLSVVSTWEPARVERLAAALEAARHAANPRSAAEAVIAENEDLVGIATRLLIPRDAGQFWAFVAALVGILTLLTASRSDPTIIVNEQTVVEHIIYRTPPPKIKKTKQPERRAIPKKPKKRPKRPKG